MSATYHIKNNKNDVYQRSTVADMLNPDNGYRGQLKRRGIQAKDHMRDNVKTLKDTQRRNRELREQEENQPPKELYKLPQFRDVTPRLYDNTPAATSTNSNNNNNNQQSPRNQNNDQQQQRNFLLKNQSQARMNELIQEKRIVRNQLEKELPPATDFHKAEVPRTNELIRYNSSNNINNNTTPRQQRDFITQNRNSVLNPPSLNNHSNNQDSANKAKHEFYGRVPDYLADRQAQWAYDEEMKRRNAPDPNCPPGMVLMAETDRLATLQSLHTNREEYLVLLSKMPFVLETPTQKRKHGEIEAKVREIENAIGIFNRPKVYVAK